MASKVLEYIVKVTDAASANAKKAEDSIKKMGKSADGTSQRFKEFNRVLFSTTAYLGIFTKAFSSFTNTIAQAAELDRLTGQFEKVFGSRSQTLKLLQNFTNTTIDQAAFMKEALSLKQLGIMGDIEGIAPLLAKAGVAAKKAGMDSGEGVRHISEFLKTGSVANASFLNLLAATNPKLQVQMAILEKSGGVMGKMLSTQQKINLVMGALNAAVTEQDLKEKDLMDSTRRLGEAFKFLKMNIGAMIGKELSGLFDKVSSITESFNGLLERIQKVDKTFLSAIKNIVITTGSTVALVGAFGTLRLAMMALSSLGVGGIPLISALMLGLAAATSDTFKPMEAFVEFLKKTGAVLMGVGQLVFSFLGDADNFQAGIGKMDKKLHDFLKKEGLLDFATNIAKVSSVIIKFSKDVAETLVDAFNKIGDVLKSISKLFDKFFASSDPQTMSRKWLDSSSTIRKVLVGLSAAMVGGFMLKGVLSKVPIIGSLFKGSSSIGGKAPRGTHSDPIYTKDASAMGFMKNLAIGMGAGDAAMAGKGILPRGMEGLSFAFKSLVAAIDPVTKAFIALGLATAAGKGIADIITSLIERMSGIEENREMAATIGTKSARRFSAFAERAGVQLPNDALKAGLTEVQKRIGGGMTQDSAMQGVLSDIMSGKMQQTSTSFEPVGFDIMGKPIMQKVESGFKLNVLDQQKPSLLNKMGIFNNEMISKPKMEDIPSSEAERISTLQEAFGSLMDDQKSRLGEAMKIAYEDKKITKDEMYEAMLAAFDNSELKKMKQKQMSDKKPDHSNLSTRRC